MFFTAKFKYSLLIIHYLLLFPLADTFFYYFLETYCMWEHSRNLCSLSTLDYSSAWNFHDEESKAEGCGWKSNSSNITEKQKTENLLWWIWPPCPGGLGKPSTPCYSVHFPVSTFSRSSQGIFCLPKVEWSFSHPRSLEEIWIWTYPAGYFLLKVYSSWSDSADYQEARWSSAVRQLQGKVSDEWRLVSLCCCA